MGEELDLGLLGLEPGKLIWGQLGKAWWPGRVSSPSPPAPAATLGVATP
jgi:hypothetical protein